MRGGAIHARTTFVILCNASMNRNRQPATTDTLLALTPIFSGRKAMITQINSSHTDKLSAAMRGSRNFRQWGGGGGGGGGGVQPPSQSDKKSSDSVVC